MVYFFLVNDFNFQFAKQGSNFYLLICFAFNVGAFEAPFILGGGYPDTLPVVAWRYFNDANYAFQLQGMATVVSIGIVSGSCFSSG